MIDTVQTVRTIADAAKLARALEPDSKSPPTLSIRILRDEPTQEVGGLRFEVENTSSRHTSLEPVIRESFLYPSKGRIRRGRAAFDVREMDRSLPPFEARILHASARTALPPGYGCAALRVYKFRARGGRITRVRIRNALLQPLSLPRYWWEWFAFRALGRVTKDRVRSIVDYRALKRSQGPH